MIHTNDPLTKAWAEGDEIRREQRRADEERFCPDESDAPQFTYQHLYAEPEYVGAPPTVIGLLCRDRLTGEEREFPYTPEGLAASDRWHREREQPMTAKDKAA